MTKDQNDMQEPVPNRWQVLRDTVAFQFKLLMDGARDVLRCGYIGVDFFARQSWHLF